MNSAESSEANNGIPVDKGIPQACVAETYSSQEKPTEYKLDIGAIRVKFELSGSLCAASTGWIPLQLSISHTHLENVVAREHFSVGTDQFGPDLTSTGVPRMLSAEWVPPPLVPDECASAADNSIGSSDRCRPGSIPIHAVRAPQIDSVGDRSTKEIINEQEDDNTALQACVLSETSKDVQTSLAQSQVALVESTRQAGGVNRSSWMMTRCYQLIKTPSLSLTAP